MALLVDAALRSFYVVKGSPTDRQGDSVPLEQLPQPPAQSNRSLCTIYRSVSVVWLEFLGSRHTEDSLIS